MIPRIALVAMFIGTLTPAGFTQTAALFELPAPTGKSPVGTTRWVVKDTSRAETFAPGTTREVEVIAWYPAVASDIIYRGSASKYYRVDVKDTLHIDLSDMNFWGGPLRQRGAFGAIAPARASEVTRTIVREFFGQEILGQKSGLLAGERKWDGVTVAQFTKAVSVSQ